MEEMHALIYLTNLLLWLFTDPANKTLVILSQTPSTILDLDAALKLLSKGANVALTGRSQGFTDVFSHFDGVHPLLEVGGFH